MYSAHLIREFMWIRLAPFKAGEVMNAQDLSFDDSE